MRRLGVLLLLLHHDLVLRGRHRLPVGLLLLLLVVVLRWHKGLWRNSWRSLDTSQHTALACATTASDGAAV